MRTDDSKNSSTKNEGRRKFLKNAALLTGTGAAAVPGLNYGKTREAVKQNPLPESGEALYNGIELPWQWPPRTMIPDSYDPMPLAYLASPPRIVPIDVGRQFFVDDFLIEKTDLKRIRRSLPLPVK